MNDTPFVHLRSHSAYSLSMGAIKVSKLVRLCVENNMPAIALTDLGNMFGVLEFSIECSKNGVQPIIGCILNITPPPLTIGSALSSHKTFQENTFSDQLLMLAQNEQGYQNLIKLASMFYLNPSNPLGTPELNFGQLQGLTDGIIALSGGKNGSIARLLSVDKDCGVSYAKDLSSAFLNRFYIEISRHHDPAEDQIEDDLLNIAFDLNLPIVATNSVFFETPKMHEAHNVLLCIGQGKTINDETRLSSSPEYYFKSQQEMKQLFADLPEAINNTSIIAQRCSFMVESKKPMLPSFPVSDGKTEEDELYEKSKIGLKARLDTIKKLYQIPDSEFENFAKQYFDRLDYEIQVISKMGFCGYFLIISDFVQWAKSNKIPVGPGRGSGAGSVVAWSLTITDVDPLKFSLLFERFLNPERVSMPDFDIDFCQKRRDEVIEYVRQRYGKDKVAQIITFGKLQARAVLRDVGRVLQMPYGYVDKICKLIPNNPSLNITIAQAMEMEPLLKKHIEDDQNVAQLIKISMQLEGLYRHASTHAAGVVIGQRPLDEIVALYSDPKSEIPITQFNMKFIEQTGLVKFDFLGLKTLTVIQQTIDLLEKRGINIVLQEIPLDDKKTFELFNNLDTTGVFQVESGGMKDVAKQLRPDRFEDLVALVALYRPGPMDDIPRYINCKHGKEAVVYAHPSIEPILKETYGVMVYQEQVMQIAQVLSGYTLGQADLLRRAMGKKIKEEMDVQRKRFVDGAGQHNNMPSAEADKLFDQISKFASYGFNKCHSTPYALISYQTAYLKANYPVEFMTATMNLDLNNTEKLSVYKQELEKLGIELLPPDINKSEPDFSVETKNNKLAIRYGLSAIKGQGVVAMESLVSKRKSLKRDYAGITDIASVFDSKVANKKHLEGLICAGCFDSINPNRRMLFENIEKVLNIGAKEQETKNSNQASLFDMKNDNAILKDDGILTEYSPWSNLEKLNNELKVMGFYISSHPLESYKKYYNKLQIKGFSELESYFEKNPSTTCNIAGVLLDSKIKIAKSGNKFAFITLSDTSATFETVMFSDVLFANRELLKSGSMLKLSIIGKIYQDVLRLNVQSVEPLDDAIKKNLNKLQLKFNDENDLSKIQQILSQVPQSDIGIPIELKSSINRHDVTLDLGKYDINAEILSKLEEFYI